MNRSQLKMLAVITMLIDHVGAVFFPAVPLFRIIGRLSFPLFCFFISEGLLYTTNIKGYLERLFLFALISEVPYDLAFHKTVYYPQSQNVFFTLFLGLAAIAILHTYLVSRPVPAVLLAVSCALLAEVLHTDYGWFGVVLIIIFYCFKNFRTRGVLVFTVLNTGYSLLTGPIKLYAALAGFPILVYNGKKGKLNWKYFFYAFYPVHLLILYLVYKVAF
ncbi:TraX family protein [Caproiciproducens faecalis]|uniref:TraX protein n=1 Tax=Caproiciproducens faecalis TaxID=2820301 RepID=A0ABS7DQ93_9FIRM|nr:TraX family protein [Caproiciproducens faecalis]MBW7573276.1 hypothetical protein [Caproiciproducens faecalis]